MAYQNVGTPRFYIDQIQYLKSVGFDFVEWHEDYCFVSSGTQLLPYDHNGAVSKLIRTMGQDPDLFTFDFTTQKYIVSTGREHFTQDW